MKKLFFAMILVFLSGFVYAGDDERTMLYIRNLTVSRLDKIPENKMIFKISSPGALSGNCQLAIRSNFSVNLSKFSEQFNFTRLSDLKPIIPDASIPGALLFKLKLDLGVYEDGIMMETKNGSSIAEAREGLLSDQKVGVLAVVCTTLPRA